MVSFMTRPIYYRGKSPGVWTRRQGEKIKQYWERSISSQVALLKHVMLDLQQ